MSKLCLANQSISNNNREKWRCAISPKKLSVGKFLLYNREVKSEPTIHISNWHSEGLPRKHRPWVSIQKSSSLTSSRLLYHVSIFLKPESRPYVPFSHIQFNPMPPSLFSPPWFRTSPLLPWGQSSSLSLPQSVSDNAKFSKIQAPQHDGPGSLWFSPCQHFRPHLPLIHSPPSPLVPNKTNPLHQGKLWIFFKWAKKRLLVVLSSPVHPTGLFSSFFAFELFYFYKV